MSNGTIATEPMAEKLILPQPDIKDAVAASPLALCSSPFSVWGRYKQRLHSLPQAIDELGLEMGLDVIDLMCNDPQITGPLDTVIYSARSRGLRLTPRYKRGHALYTEGIKAYDEGQWLLEFAYDSKDSELEMALDDCIEDHMRTMLTIGHGIAEVQGIYRPGDTAGRPPEKTRLAQKLGGLTLPRSLRVKSPQDTSFVIDSAGGCKYIAVRLADTNLDWMAYYQGMSPAQQNDPFWVNQVWLLATLGITLPGGWALMPTSKFVVMTNKLRRHDHRGQSALRPAYAAWYMTMLLWPEYHKFLRQCATPGIYIEMPPNAIPERDPRSGKMVSPEDKVFEAVSNYEGGGVLIGKNGMKATPFWSQSDGTAYSRAFETLGREKARAIQMSILQSDVAHNNTRAASQTHKDIGDLAADSVKKTTQGAYFLQYFRRFFALNHGETYARLFTPFCGLGELAREDKVAMVASMGSAGYTIAPSQLHDLDQEMEMPERSDDDIAAMGAGNTDPDPDKSKTDPQKDPKKPEKQ